MSSKSFEIRAANIFLSANFMEVVIRPNAELAADLVARVAVSGAIAL